MNKFILWLLAFLLGIFFMQGQSLTRKEKRLTATVSKNLQESIQFLEEVVNINSGTLNLAGVKQVGDRFGAAFSDIGFETRWIPMPAEMNRAGHLFAEIKGDKGKKLVLIGHLDTVFEADSPFQTYEKVNDSIVHAPGGNDMKGGNVVVLYALKALRENGLLDGAQIIVAFTGDEESAGKPYP